MEPKTEGSVRTVLSLLQRRARSSAAPQPDADSGGGRRTVLAGERRTLRGGGKRMRSRTMTAAPCGHEHLGALHRLRGSERGEVDFHGERRSNATHRSTTDPESRMYKKTKGREARVRYLGHGLMENRTGLMVKTRLALTEGTAEREAALAIAKQMRGCKRRTLAADKNYDTRDFVRRLRQMHITPQVAQNTTNRSSAIDRRTTRHAG